MRIVTVHFTGQAPYSPSRAHCVDKLPKETPDAYEERTWKEKAHVEEGFIVIPPMAFKMSVDGRRMLGRQIPGKSTYTSFRGGVIVTEAARIAPVGQSRRGGFTPTRTACGSEAGLAELSAD
jgi:hypothetical protein